MPGICPRCLREVYFAEEKLALGKVWHTFCFSCRNCRKLLDSWTVATHSGELYCRNCHNRLFPTTSIRTALPPSINPIFPPADTGDLEVLPCDSLSDCCCYCYCNDDCALIDARNVEEKVNELSDSPEEKQRMRGGGGEDEDLDASSPLEARGTKRSSDVEDSQLDAQSFVTTLCDPPLSPTAVTAWHNKHHSASQRYLSHWEEIEIHTESPFGWECTGGPSLINTCLHSCSTFSRPSSAQRPPIRPSSTPASGEIAANRNANTCSGNRIPGSPCRRNHKHYNLSKPCHRHLGRGFIRADKIVGSPERGKFVKEFRGGHFLANYRNHLRLQPSDNLGVSSPSTKGLPSSVIQPHHKTPKLHQATKNLTIYPPRPTSSYPPLPPNYSPSLRRRNSTKEGRSEYQTSCYPAMQNIVDESRNKVDIITFEHSSHHSQPTISEGHFSSSPIEAHDNVEGSDDPGNSDDECRLRGGCGGGGGSGCCCSSGPTKSCDRRTPSPCSKRYQSDRSSTVEGACGCSGRGRNGCGVNAGGCCSSEGESGHSPTIGGCCSDSSNEGACASKCGSVRCPTGFETCPPRSPDPCSSDPSSLSPCSAVACSPPCSGRKGCCPPAGCRPVRRRIARCNSPCIGDSQSCGGGGCCGGGCRGGCGKPGQTCLPLRPCTIPPCVPQPRSGGSPCMPPRRCPPQPPCCRSPVLPGTPGSMSGSGGSSCCRSGSPGGRVAGGGGCSTNQGCQQMDDGLGIGSGCQTKLPAGCECLGGGQDCQRCGRKVYQAEMQIASGVPYHNICFSCFCCRKPLETLTYHENCGEIYCKQCYVRNFGPQGYGYAGVLQTPM